MRGFVRLWSQCQCTLFCELVWVSLLPSDERLVHLRRLLPVDHMNDLLTYLCLAANY
jgi:hypothetical protein